MELGFNIQYLSKSIGTEEAARVLSGAGFRYLDYTPPLDKDWQREMDRAAESFIRHGLTVHQCHAPFNRYKRWGTKEHHKECVANSWEAAKALGAKYLVVHGDEFDFENMTYLPDAALLYNYDYFAPVVEQAEKAGVSVAFENVFEDMNVPRNCSKTEDLCALIDRFGGAVCCCWDFGHGAVSYGEKNHEAIASMGGRIRCTHVHDNYLNADMHLVPFYGQMNWEKALQALTEGGKPEVMSFELVYGSLPEEIASIAAKQVYAVGEKLLSMMPANK